MQMHLTTDVSSNEVNFTSGVNVTSSSSWSTHLAMIKAHGILGVFFLPVETYGFGNFVGKLINN
jgi:hypothetical protein